MFTRTGGQSQLRVAQGLNCQHLIAPQVRAYPGKNRLGSCWPGVSKLSTHFEVGQDAPQRLVILFRQMAAQSVSPKSRHVRRNSGD